VVLSSCFPEKNPSESTVAAYSNLSAGHTLFIYSHCSSLPSYMLPTPKASLPCPHLPHRWTPITGQAIPNQCSTSRPLPTRRCTPMTRTRPRRSLEVQPRARASSIRSRVSRVATCTTRRATCGDPIFYRAPRMLGVGPCYSGSRSARASRKSP